MASFAENYEHKCLLDIARCHREAVDLTRVYDGKVVGQDNWDNLTVSTVFAAIAVESALNDYILSHCLFIQTPYLQDVFSEITKHFLRSSVQNKIELLSKRWPESIPKELLKDLRELIRIRNRIAHQSGEFQTASQTADGRSEMKNRTLTADDLRHMLRHYDIARDFLGRFWLPGNRELQQGHTSAELV